MKTNLLNFQNEVIGDLEISDSIFCLSPRQDIIKRVIDWQMAKKRGGNHSVKTVGEVSGTTKKPFNQKGTGRARQGNARGVQRRGGGVAHGPQIRSHAFNLQKKVRRLGLKHALSVKFNSGHLYFIDSLKIGTSNTGKLKESLSRFGIGKFCIIAHEDEMFNLKLSSASLQKTNVLPAIGANVYDIINSNNILISKDVLQSLDERLE